MKIITPSLLLFFLFHLPNVNKANYQEKEVAYQLSDTVKTKTTGAPSIQNETPQKDLSDVFSSIFKKNHTKKTQPDTITSRPIFSIIPAVGYSLQTKLAAVLSGNMAFKMSNTSRLSVISGSMTYTQNKQFYIPIQSNIWTKHHSFNLVGDYRFYKYPQSTYGLGSNAPKENENPMDYSLLRFYQIVYKKVVGNLYGGIGYIVDYRWNISQKGIKNGTVSDYEKYGLSKSSLSSGITINALYDTRDNIINASKGTYVSVQLRNNLQTLGSHSNWFSLIMDARKFIHIKKSSKNVIAFWYYNWIILKGKPPYLDLPSIGWDSYNCTGRGYIQGRFRGSKMIYLESEYRFGISSNGLLGGTIFMNASSFSATQGTTYQKIQPGYGIGARIKIKKKSKTNIGIDYGFGTKNSRGLFINIGEYF